MFRIPLLLLVLSLAAFSTHAADEAALGTNTKAASQPPPPALPDDPVESLPEPEVQIIHREDRTIEEYRVNGQLRYVRVIPVKGPPYYFVDTDGDGVLDQQFNSLDNPPLNQWILMRW